MAEAGSFQKIRASRWLRTRQWHACLSGKSSDRGQIEGIVANCPTRAAIFSGSNHASVVERLASVDGTVIISPGGGQYGCK
jgi:hypothetical protein